MNYCFHIMQKNGMCLVQSSKLSVYARKSIKFIAVGAEKSRNYTDKKFHAVKI